MYFGFMKKAFGAKAFVLRECRLNPNARVPIVLIGRRGGLFSWVKSLLGLDDSVVLEVSPSEISISTTSLAGRLRESIPTVAVSNLGVGYLKPIGFILMALATLPVICEVFRALLETSDPLLQVRLAWQLAASIFFFISSVAAYFLRKCVVFHVISRSGFDFDVAFSRSMVEGVPMDVSTGQWIIDAFLALKFNRPIKPVPAGASILSADRTRTGFLLWVSGICTACISAALVTGWLTAKTDETQVKTVSKPASATGSSSHLHSGDENLVAPPPPKAVKLPPKAAEPPPPKAAEPQPKVVSGTSDYMGEGLIALRAKDYSRALKMFGTAAEGGDPAAFNALGLMFRNSLGIDADPEAAVVFFRAACDSIPQANAELAACFETGYGVRKSALVARSYYRRAMEMGYLPAGAKVESLRKASMGEEMGQCLLRAQEDLRLAESACEQSGYEPLESALQAVRRKASEKTK